MGTRTLQDIEADVRAAHAARDQVADWISKLAEEKRQFFLQRRRKVVEAFDAGGTRAQIVEAFPDLDYMAINQILTKMGRTEKRRQSQGMSPEQKRQFEKLVARGVGKGAARSIVLNPVT